MSILAIQNPIYKPAMRIIASITNATPAVVTTTFAHNYITGIIIRLHIPLGYGMQQAADLYAPITVINTTSFSIDIDTTLMSPFAYPESSPQDLQYPQSIPVGEVNSTLLAAVKNVLPY